jgi:ribosomal-protein-alanine N-acetyltransferase
VGEPLVPSLSVRVTSARLVLRAPRDGDVGELRRLARANIEHLRPWEPASPPGEDPTSLTAIASAVTRQRRDWRRGDSFSLLITGREEGEPILGRVTLGGVLRRVFQNAYLGYWIDRDRQKMGLMTEAVTSALAFAFIEAKLHRVQVAIMPRNVASLRVVEKIGFRLEGHAERYLKIAGAWEDHEIFAMTSEEWIARNP